MPPMFSSLADRKVLYAARFAAHEAVPTLAQRTGLRTHVVQRSLGRLRDAQVTTPYVAVDISKLGLVDYAVFFSVSAESETAHKRLLSFLRGSPHVPWVVELSGTFHYAFSFACRHISELDEFLLELGKRVEVAMTQRAVLCRTSWSVFPPAYLLPELRTAPPGYQIIAGRDLVKCDELDLKLLRVLSSPKIVTVTECARKLREPVNTIRYRKSNLEAKGVIVCYALGIDPVRLGRIPYLCLVQVKTPGEELRRRLHAFVARQPVVTCISACIGAWDYELSIEVEKPEELAVFQRKLFEQFPNEFVSVQNLGVLQTHKLEPLPSLPLGDT